MARRESRPQPSARFGLPADREKITEFASNRQWVVLDGCGLPYPVTLSAGIGDDGRLRCTGVILGALTAEPVEITSASLRDVRVTELLQQIASTGDLLEPLFSYSGPREGRPFLDRLIPGLVPDLPPQVPPVRGGALPRGHFEVVANEYRRALVVDTHAPMTELRHRLAEWLDREIPEPTARRWVQRARDMGLLGASRPGKAGEKPATPDPP
jgi:hypothetical protein